MTNQKVAFRYARALFEIGQEKNLTERFIKDLREFSDLLARVPELGQCLLGPLYTTEDQRAVGMAAAKKIDVSEAVEGALLLLIDKRRILCLNDVVEAMELLYDEAAGRVKAKIISAKELRKEDYETIKKSIEKIVHKTVVLTTIVEPEIIGGVIAEVGDKIFDGSVRTQIHKIGETLT